MPNLKKRRMWTDGQADSHRYKQMGNAVTVNVAEWIGKRIIDTSGAARMGMYSAWCGAAHAGFGSWHCSARLMVQRMT